MPVELVFVVVACLRDKSFVSSKLPASIASFRAFSALVKFTFSILWQKYSLHFCYV